MYDGSVLSYEENFENTKKAVEMAKKFGASVEAELGSMGKRESGAGDDGAGVVDYLNSLKDGEKIFFSSIYMAEREAMKENVKSAMKVFAGIE